MVRTRAWGPTRAWAPTRRLHFATPGVTLRSSTGIASDVVIDGEYQTNEMIFIHADDVSILDLTLRRAVDHLIHVTGDSNGNVRGTILRNLQLGGSGEQFVKVNSDGQGHYVDDGLLECSRFLMTDDGRPNVETNPGGCYTGGIDAHSARGWRVRLNEFRGIYDPYSSVGYIGHYDGLVRNNLIYVGAGGGASPYFDTGIELAQAHGARVYHNTIASTPSFSSIDFRFANTSVTIRNNLTRRITQRDGATGVVDHNLENTPVSLFRDTNAGDFRLRGGSAGAAAIDQGVDVPEAGLDLDGMPHTAGAPDLGAYEWR